MNSVPAGSEFQANTGGWRYGWSAALMLLGLATLAVTALLWPSVVTISHIWFNSDTYQHGMAILPLALFLAWTRRGVLAQVAPTPSAWGLVWLAAAGIAWILARSVDVNLVQHFALIAMLPGLVVTLLGLRVAWILVFPLAYLFFAVPFGDFIVPRLQEYTAWFSVLMIRLSGLPVFQDGYYISIPAGDFVVGEVCSGVRYLIASVALGLVYAYISYRSIWRRLALVVLAIVLPIVANGLRAYGIIMIAHWSDMRHAVGVDHIIYGWFFFGLVMVLLFWLGSLWWEKDPSPSATGATGSPGAQYTPVSPAYLMTMIVALTVVLASPRAGDLWLRDRASHIAVAVVPELPASLAGWDGPVGISERWHPVYHDADTVVTGAYQRTNPHAGPMVELHLYHYINRGEGSEIVSWRNRTYDSRNWRRSSEGRRNVRRADGQALAVNETVLTGQGGTRVVWHWYQIGVHATAQGVEVKLREAEALLRGDGRGSVMVAVSAVGGPSAEEVRSVLAAFVSGLPLPLDFRPDG